tara:strand:- start:1057 stop:1737 length:681 start_codon:yes stop_codon:yes gene_type:complete
MTKHIILLSACLTTSLFAEDKYRAITDRNAFALLDKAPDKVELPPLVLKQPIDLKLTGIIRFNKLTKVYLYSKDIPERYITLSEEEPYKHDVLLIRAVGGTVEVMNNGVKELLAFNTHRLPTTVINSKPKLPLPTVESFKALQKRVEEKRKSEVKPNIVKVPSRRIEPIPIDKDLLKKTIKQLDSEEQREEMMKRLLNLRNGQRDLNFKIDSNERRRQYDERRRRE